MRLIVDASILVTELLRRRGQQVIASLDLRLFVAELAWAEAQYELDRRVARMLRHGRLSAASATVLLRDALALAALRIAVIPVAIYSPWETLARARIPRDPADWPTVAATLELDAGIWTQDHDFLGCGLPTWTTETLIAHLGFLQNHERPLT